MTSITSVSPVSRLSSPQQMARPCGIPGCVLPKLPADHIAKPLPAIHSFFSAIQSPSSSAFFRKWPPCRSSKRLGPDRTMAITRALTADANGVSGLACPTVIWMPSKLPRTQSRPSIVLSSSPATMRNPISGTCASATAPPPARCDQDGCDYH